MSFLSARSTQNQDEPPSTTGEAGPSPAVLAAHHGAREPSTDRKLQKGYKVPIYHT